MITTIAIHPFFRGIIVCCLVGISLPNLNASEAGTRSGIISSLTRWWKGTQEDPELTAFRAQIAQSESVLGRELTLWDIIHTSPHIRQEEGYGVIRTYKRVDAAIFEDYEAGRDLARIVLTRKEVEWAQWLADQADAYTLSDDRIENLYGWQLQIHAAMWLNYESLRHLKREYYKLYDHRSDSLILCYNRHSPAEDAGRWVRAIARAKGIGVYEDGFPEEAKEEEDSISPHRERTASHKTGVGTPEGMPLTASSSLHGEHKSHSDDEDAIAADTDDVRMHLLAAVEADANADIDPGARLTHRAPLTASAAASSAPPPADHTH